MKNIFENKFIKKICLTILFINVGIILINQQKTLNSYNSQQAYYEDKIKSAKLYQQTLINEKDNLNSDDYIEKIAREKLDMYSDNERVYIDINK